MGKSSGAEPTDPKLIASSQIGANIQTALANLHMNNVDQAGPDGTVKTATTGYTTVNDPFSGRTYQIPNRTQTTTLSPAGQAIKTQRDASGLSLATAGKTGAAAFGAQQPFAFQGAFNRADTAPAQQQPFAFQGQFGGQESAYKPQGQFAFESNFNAAGLPQSGDANPGAAFALGDDAREAKLNELQQERLNPMLDQQREQMAQQLANQGIKLGSTGYDRALLGLNQGQNDARTQMILNSRGLINQELSQEEAVRQGRVAQDRSFRAQLFGEDQAGQDRQGQAEAIRGARLGQDEAIRAARLGQFQQGQDRQAQQQGIRMGQTAQDEAIRGARFGEFNTGQDRQAQQRQLQMQQLGFALNGGQYQTPQASQPAQSPVANTDYAALQANNDQIRQQQAQQRAQQQQGLWGSLLGLGSTALMFSDDRVKKDKQRVGEVKGMGLHMFRYKGEPETAPLRLGLMASEVERVRPEAVVTLPGGVRAVDYGIALGR